MSQIVSYIFSCHYEFNSIFFTYDSYSSRAQHPAGELHNASIPLPLSHTAQKRTYVSFVQVYSIYLGQECNLYDAYDGSRVVVFPNHITVLFMHPNILCISDMLFKHHQVVIEATTFTFSFSILSYTFSIPSSNTQ